MKAVVSVTYTADIEIGDVPASVVQTALEKDSDGTDFNIFEFKDAATISSVEVEV